MAGSVRLRCSAHGGRFFNLGQMVALGGLVLALVYTFGGEFWFWGRHLPKRVPWPLDLAALVSGWIIAALLVWLGWELSARQRGAGVIRDAAP